MRRLSVKQGTVCPLCPDHHDDEFVWSDVVQEPICIGCSYEIYYGLEFEEQPSANNYNNYLTVHKMLIHCDITYDEARRRHYLEITSSLQNRQNCLEKIINSGLNLSEGLNQLRNEIQIVKNELQLLVTKTDQT